MCRTSICFSSASLRKLNLELEEQARILGAAPWRVRA
jgi:ABC-type Fe3+ transport system permease subunit